MASRRVGRQSPSSRARGVNGRRKRNSKLACERESPERSSSEAVYSFAYPRAIGPLSLFPFVFFLVRCRSLFSFYLRGFGWAFRAQILGFVVSQNFLACRTTPSPSRVVPPPPSPSSSPSRGPPSILSVLAGSRGPTPASGSSSRGKVAASEGASPGKWLLFSREGTGGARESFSEEVQGGAVRLRAAQARGAAEYSSGFLCA